MPSWIDPTRNASRMAAESRCSGTSIAAITLKTAIEKTGMILEYGDPARVERLLRQEHTSVAKLAETVDLGT